MPDSPTWRRYLRFWRPDINADVDDEVRFHLETRVEELLEAGVPPEVARAQAADEFGDVRQVREELRAIDKRMHGRRSRAERAGGVAREVRWAARRLARQPGFSVPAALTLALGIGATAAVFTLLDAVVLRPLPYPESHRLVRLDSPVPGVGPETRWGLGRGEFLYFKREGRAFDALGLYRYSSTTIGASGTTEAQAEYVRAAQVSAGVAAVLGVTPQLGRMIATEDNLAERAGVVLLGDAFWRRRFGGDPAVVGRTIALGGRDVQVIGVLPARARLPEELASPGTMTVDLWLPLYLDPAQPAANNHVFDAVGRLAPGSSVSAARDELARLTARLPEALPEAYDPAFLKRTGFSTAVTPLRDDVLGGIARVLWILFGAMGLVLAIAGANVANLYLARIETRRREMTVRAALGAGRGELAWHFLAETMVLAAVAGAGALALAHWGIALLVAAAPASIPRLPDVHLGWSAGALVLLLSLGAGLLFGLLPMAQRRADLGLLREAGRGLTTSRRQQATRDALVVAQVALSLVLLAGAGLLARSFRRLNAVRPGVDVEGVLTFRVVLPGARYETSEQLIAYYRAAAERLEAVPGVRTVGFTEHLPLTGEYGCSALVIEDRAPGAADRAPCVPVILVTPGYFRALGIDVRGRQLEWPALSAGTQEAVVSGAFARRVWPGEQAIGKGVKPGNEKLARFDVVGVTGDVRENGLDQPAVDAVYLPIVPSTGDVIGRPRQLTAVVRAATTDPAALAALTPALRRALAELDPQVPMTDVRPMRDVAARSVARRSFATLLLGVASGLALVLSAVGLYGVIAYLVARRRAEIGIRMALGAPRAEVARLVVLRSLRLAALGVAVGLAGAVAGTRLLGALLYEVDPTDPMTLGSVSLFLLAVAALASYAPARRAMRVDPVEALRSE